ncbi:MAG: glycoside hydrolase family 9 protein, partial [Colwellia sp.]
DNGKENIIDDYTALIAATELYRITKKSKYLKAARRRAHNLNNRMTSQGWFVSDDDERPFYHGVEAGLPIIALVDYLAIERNRQIKAKTKRTIKLSLNYQLALNSQVSNPFNLARQTFQTYNDELYSKAQDGFFMPHANETNYWWQGESSRLASLTAAAIWGGKITHSDKGGAFGINKELAYFAQSQIDWIMGKNPYQVCMLYGFGVNNPPHAKSAGTMLNGGISNGITGATSSPDGRGITWAEGPDENNKRWVEQWLQNSTWYLLAMTAMTE